MVKLGKAVGSGILRIMNRICCIALWSLKLGMRVAIRSVSVVCNRSRWGAQSIRHEWLFLGCCVCFGLMII